MVSFSRPPKRENIRLVTSEGINAGIDDEPKWFNVSIYELPVKIPLGCIVTKQTSPRKAAEHGDAIFLAHLKRDVLYVLKCDPMRDEFEPCAKYADRFIEREEQLRLAALPMDRFVAVLNGKEEFV